MVELRCGTCGQLDYDELKERYDKVMAFIIEIAQAEFNCREVDIHFAITQDSARNLLKELEG